MPSDEPDPLQSLIAEILEAENSGESVDRDAIMAEHPDFADSLRGFFAQHERMKVAADQEDPMLLPIGGGHDDPTIPPNQGTQEEATMPPRLADEDPTIPPTRASTDGSVQRKLEVLRNMPFLTILLVMVGGFVGVASALGGAVFAALRRGSFAARLRQAQEIGGQLGMIGGMICGTLITLLYIITRPPASGAEIVDGTIVWPFMFLVILPPFFAGFLAPDPQPVETTDGSRIRLENHS